jgi:hypothetical protein
MVPSRLDGLSGIRGAVDEEEATALSKAELRFWLFVVEEGPATALLLEEAPFSSHGLGLGGSDDAMLLLCEVYGERWKRVWIGHANSRDSGVQYVVF